MRFVGEGLGKNRAPDLTSEQVDAIISWAERTSCIAEVRLFGSRAGSQFRGEPRPGSDVDLALTIEADPDEVESILIEEGRGWRAELGSLTGLDVKTSWYEKDQHPEVFQYCQHASVTL